MKVNLNKVKGNLKSYMYLKNYSAYGFRKVLLQCFAPLTLFSNAVHTVYSRYTKNNSAVQCIYVVKGKVLPEFKHPVNCTISVCVYRFRYRSAEGGFDS
jgi:hypothetical protein